MVVAVESRLASLTTINWIGLCRCSTMEESVSEIVSSPLKAGMITDTTGAGFTCVFSGLPLRPCKVAPDLEVVLEQSKGFLRGRRYESHHAISRCD